MDNKTQSAYEKRATIYSQQWLAQPAPTDMYEILSTFFIPGGTTADIGCGNGRDSQWLAQKGFAVSGFDSCPELLAIATRLYPKISFRQAVLPELSEISQRFQNVFCETVIMHLPKEMILPALAGLKRILEKQGILYLSWRVTEGEDVRHADGRLYSAFEPAYVLAQLEPKSVLHFEDKISESSGKRVCRLIYRAD